MIIYPKRAKGCPYTDTETSSAAMVNPYDSFIDFANKKLILVYGTTKENETIRSIITYIQDDEPQSPSLGEIWINSLGATKIFRTTYTWEDIAVPPPPPAMAFQNDEYGDLMPTIDGESDLFENDIDLALQETGVVTSDNVFESDSESITPKV